LIYFGSRNISYIATHDILRHLKRRRKKMNKQQIVTIVFLMMLSICAFTTIQARACETNGTYSASISPTTTDTSLTHISYTITFTDTGSSNMGSGTITIPSGYSAVSLTSVTASGGQTWTESISSSTISFSASSSSGKITTDQTVKVVLTATNPASAGSYTWKTAAYSEIGQSGTAFTADPVTVTVNNAPTVSLSPSLWTMEPNQQETFTATASSGSGTYASYQWYVDGSAQSGQTASTFEFVPVSEGSYTITATVTDSLGATSAPSSAATVTVNQLTIKVTQTANGLITPGTSNVNYGDTPTFNITPAYGYYISSITADDLAVPVTSPTGQAYQFSPISASGSLTATFAINTYNLIVNVGVDGSSNIASQTVNWGSVENFAFTPNTGYSVSDVIVNGTNDKGAVNSLSLTITGDSTVSVSFSINTYTITVNEGANGVIAPGTSTVNYGATPSFTITPNAGYYIASITANGSAVTVTSSSGQTYQFSAVSANDSITATFALSSNTQTSTSTPTPSPTPTPTAAAPQTQTITPTPIPTVKPTPTPTAKPTPTHTPTPVPTRDPTATPHTSPSPTPLYVVLIAIISFAAIIILLLLTLVVRRLKRKVNQALPNPQAPL
jgi:hypothetical protein